MSFFVSNDIRLFDLDVVHGFLKDAYWCKDIPRVVVEQAMQNSLAFGVFKKNSNKQINELTPVQGTELVHAQVGYARVITDKTTFAYLADVFILPEYRGNGLGKLLMQHILAHHDLQNLRRFLLATRDAHELYKQFGFTEMAKPQSMMEILKPNPYATGDA